MKLGQLTEYNKGNIFPQNAENESGRLVPVPFYFFLKTRDMRWKQVVCNLFSIYFDSP